MQYLLRCAGKDAVVAPLVFARVLFLVMFFGWPNLTILSGCKDYGNRLMFNGSELYYTPSVQEQTARRVGSRLISNGIFGEKAIRIQLDRRGEYYYLRLWGTYPDSRNRPEFVKTWRVVAIELSLEILDNRTVEVELCDDDFETVSTITVRHSLGLSPEEFMREWNLVTQEIELSGYQIRLISVENGPVQNVFSMSLRDGVIHIQGAVNKGDGSVRDISIISGRLSPRQARDFLSCMSALIRVASHEHLQEEAVRVIRDLHLFDQGVNLESHVTKGDVIYEYRGSDIGMFMLTAKNRFDR